MPKLKFNPSFKKHIKKYSISRGDAKLSQAFKAYNQIPEYQEIFNTKPRFESAVRIYKHLDKNKDGITTKFEVWQGLLEFDKMLIKTYSEKIDGTAPAHNKRHKIRIEYNNFDRIWDNESMQDFTTDTENNQSGLKFDDFINLYLKLYTMKKDSVSSIPKFEKFTNLVATEEDFNAAYSLFSEIDDNQNGYIEKHELKELFAKLKADKSDDELKIIFENMDMNYDGRLQFSEFLVFLNNKQDPFVAFNLVFDLNRDGYCDFQELKAVLKSTIEIDDSDDEIVRQIMGLYDKNGDGKISYEEYVDYIENNQ